MNSDHGAGATNHQPDDSAARPTNGSGSAKEGGFVQRAVSRAVALASRLDDQIRRKPYAALGLACLAGTGVGVLFSSRIVRGILTTAATAAAVEVSRSFIRQQLAKG